MNISFDEWNVTNIRTYFQQMIQTKIAKHENLNYLHKKHRQKNPIPSMYPAMTTSCSSLCFSHGVILILLFVFRIEPVNSKKSSSDQRKPSNTRKSAPESGKLLNLRPTQSDHHSKTISTQRITSEQAVNLIRNDKKQDASSADQRAKSKTRKQPEHAQKLPRVNSPASSTEHDHPHKANPKGKTKKNAADDSL